MDKKELPPLNPAASQFLKVLKKFHDKQINLKTYSMMLNIDRRWLRRLLQELKEKGYVKIIPENGKVRSGGACRYIFLDGFIPEEKSEIAEQLKISEDVLKELKINRTAFDDV